MTVNLPKWVRALVYALNVLGTPVVVYARAKDWIGDLELALWGAEVAAGFTLAGLSVPGTPPLAPPTTVRLQVSREGIGQVQRGREISAAIESGRHADRRLT